MNFSCKQCCTVVLVNNCDTYFMIMRIFPVLLMAITGCVIRHTQKINQHYSYTLPSCLPAVGSCIICQPLFHSSTHTYIHITPYAYLRSILGLIGCRQLFSMTSHSRSRSEARREADWNLKSEIRLFALPHAAGKVSHHHHHAFCVYYVSTQLPSS